MSRMAASKAWISFWPLSCVLMQMVLPLRQWSRSPLNPSHSRGAGNRTGELGEASHPPCPLLGLSGSPHTSTPTFTHVFTEHLLCAGTVTGTRDKVICKKIHGSYCYLFSLDNIYFPHTIRPVLNLGPTNT